MTTQLYDLSVPAFLRSLSAMSAFLEKGRAWADENGMDLSELLEARLHADMDPLTTQVQRAADAAKFGVARLAQVEPPVMADTEQTFDELQARIAATIAFIRSVAREQIDGNEEVDVQLKTPKRTIDFKGRDYLLGFALPNFYFHLTAAYALLRMKGVPVGKLDYMGNR